MQAPIDVARRATPAWRSPWVIGWVGLVLAVLAVNLTMVYLAVVTNPGLVDDDYYERGQHYEKTLASRLARDPGWTLSPEFPQGIKLGETGTVRISLLDKSGQPVTPEAVTFYAYRSSDKSKDFSAPMKQEEPGSYVAQVSFPLFGNWDGLIAVTQGGDEYTTGGRITIGRP